jgi:hypothetical protein
MQIIFDPKRHRWCPLQQTFFMNERHVSFATQYEVVNPKTGCSERFDLKESTGSEWDPSTQWIYQSARGLRLVVSGCPEIRQRAANAYLEAKLRH